MDMIMIIILDVEHEEAREEECGMKKNTKLLYLNRKEISLGSS